MMLRTALIWIATIALAACAGESKPNPQPVPTPIETQPTNPVSGKPIPDTRQMPTDDPNFLKLNDGTDLKKVKVSGAALSLSHGTGRTFGSTQTQAFEKMYQDSLTKPGFSVQWALMDLDTGKMIEQSLEAKRRMFGASVAKVYVAAGILDKQIGTLSKSQLQQMADMLVISSNTAWTDLQKQIGNGDSNRGREYIQNFTQRMGYPETRGFQGSWGKIHGNELVASELVALLHDLYWDRIAGGSTQWKIMHTCRTGAQRGRKYLPSSLVVGGKTGTYDGPTQLDGKAVQVKVRNHLLILNYLGHQYGLAILANTGSDESAAVMAGGLFRRHIEIRK